MATVIPNNMRRILLADDHTLFRDILTTYIAHADPSTQVMSVADLHQAQHKLTTDGPFDLVMLDWHMPGMTGIDDVAQIIKAYPQTRFVLMSGVVEAEQVKKALASGFWGYFPKTLPGRALMDGVNQVLKGQKFIPTLPGSKTLVPSYHAEPATKPHAGSPQKPAANFVSGGGNPDLVAAIRVALTTRELEALGYVVKGMTNAEIAGQLGVKEVTIKLHLSNAFDKIGVRNRTEAAIKCQEIGLFVNE